MNDSIYQEKIIEIFKSKSIYFNQNSSHFIIRCPYCGDSRKRLNTGHLYIHKQIPVFRCNRCNYGGHVLKLITDLSALKLDFKKEVIKEDIDISKFTKYSGSASYSFLFDKPLQLDVKTLVQDYKNDKFKHKLNYLLRRFNYTNRFIGDVNISNKIIFDIKYLHDKNEKFRTQLKKLFPEDNKRNYILDKLQNEYIGFLGLLNNVIILRNITENNKFRYMKIKLLENQSDYFVIDRLLETVEYIPNILIAEGVFDILIPYMNITNVKDISKIPIRIFVACSGKSFIEALKFIAIQKCIFQFNIFLLADNDTNLKQYNYIYRKCKRLINSLTILTNIEEKDFGSLKCLSSIAHRF